MKYFVIYKSSNEKELVPEVVANALFEAKSPKIAWIGKMGRKQIDLATVGRIIPEEEYYLSHPEERPHKPVENLLPPIKYYNKNERINAVQNLIKGMEKFVKQNPNAYKAKGLLEKMRERKERFKNEPEQKTTIKNIIKF